MNMDRIKTAGRNAALSFGRQFDGYHTRGYDHHAMWLSARRQGATYGEALRLADNLYSDEELEVTTWEDF